jgi:hypothetical protein
MPIATAMDKFVGPNFGTPVIEGRGPPPAARTVPVPHTGVALAGALLAAELAT